MVRARRGPGGFNKPPTPKAAEAPAKSQGHRRGRMARMTTSTVSERAEVRTSSQAQSHGRSRGQRGARAAQDPAPITHCDLLGSFMINPLDPPATAL